MELRKLSVLFALVVIAVAGCKPAEVAADDGDKAKDSSVATPGKSPESMIPKTGETETKEGESKPAVEMAKCDGCSKEVAKADLVSHDGKMLCKECMAGHNH